jgi:hypothetical protein
MEELSRVDRKFVTDYFLVGECGMELFDGATARSVTPQEARGLLRGYSLFERITNGRGGDGDDGPGPDESPAGEKPGQRMTEGDRKAFEEFVGE